MPPLSPPLLPPSSWLSLPFPRASTARCVPIHLQSNKLLATEPNKYEILTSTKSEGFCTYSDPNCNFCLNITPPAKLKVCQAIDPTYKSAPGDITRGPSGVCPTKTPLQSSTLTLMLLHRPTSSVLSLAATKRRWQKSWTSRVESMSLYVAKFS